MNPRVTIALKIAAGAAILGLLGDGLLRVAPWGINVALWMLAALAVIAALSATRPGPWRSGAWLIAPALIFSAGFAWRASPVLAALNLLALGVTASLALFIAQGGRVFDGNLAEYLLAAILAGLNTAFGAIPLGLFDLPWKDLFARRGAGRALAVGRGLLLSFPPLVIFSALFASADPIFRDVMRDAFHFDLSTLVSHGVLIALFTWTAAGWLRGAALGEDRQRALGLLPTGQTVSLGIVEIGTVLGLMDALFLTFVVIQFRYLFGGEAHLQAAGLTYAEYARSGFFQLVTVAALALPLLLAAHWLLRKDHATAERTFRALAGLLVLLLLVVLASALKRMLLYQDEYGLTELRVYTTAFMAWLAVVLAWFVLTVLAGNRKRFAAGAWVAGYALIVALEILNPDSLIARTNLKRAQQGRRFDARYVASLSPDALPEVLAALPKLPEKDRCVAAERLLRRWSKNEPADWRTWNYARAYADKMMDREIPAMRNMACPASPGQD